MRQTPKVEGTKIAQAAKDLNVTSVTIRRYLSEFNIGTASDENGVKVLPQQAMEELKTIRRLKEEGRSTTEVMEVLESGREQSPKVAEVEPLDETKDQPQTVSVDADQLAQSAPAKPENDAPSEQKPKHTLTCQTCGKVFEHMNPRLRDCLDCYRTKRKERRRGGSDRHKNVIQHPLAQQVTNKAAMQNHNAEVEDNGATLPAVAQANSMSASSIFMAGTASGVIQKTSVRNYRKAVEETRQITGSLKRRLERPDLPEGDRRWLEQIYAYQLILHQGWRHLSEYKNNTETSKESTP